MLLDRQKQVEHSEVSNTKFSPSELERARLEMEQNYQHQLWKKKHKVQSLLGIRLSAISNYGMILVMGAVYFWLKYGTLDPFTQTPPRFSVTQWFKEPL